MVLNSSAGEQEMVAGVMNIRLILSALPYALKPLHMACFQHVSRTEAALRQHCALLASAAWGVQGCGRKAERRQGADGPEAGWCMGQIRDIPGLW